MAGGGVSLGASGGLDSVAGLEADLRDLVVSLFGRAVSESVAGAAQMLFEMLVALLGYKLAAEGSAGPSDWGARATRHVVRGVRLAVGNGSLLHNWLLVRQRIDHRGLSASSVINARP